MAPSFDEAIWQSQWATMCRSAQGHATMLASQLAEPFAMLLLDVARRFCCPEAPANAEQMNGRHVQSGALNSILETVCHTDLMARSRPHARQAMLDQVRVLCNRELPATNEGVHCLQMQLGGFGLMLENLGR
jgi:hypothetical protein